MPKPKAELLSSVVRAIVPEMIGLNNPEPVAMTSSPRKTRAYVDVNPVAKYPAARNEKATISIRR